jgi:23S rRNA (adenine-N6)-dimethyltransferase
VERSRRSWGWHQLDDAWAERVVAGAELGAGDLVLDVGAGTGALTRPLLDIGARVIAVERHPGRADALQARFGDRIVVVRADAADLRLPRRPFHVVANPPFSITTPLLDRLLHPGSRLVSAHLVLQRQVVRRWVAEGAAGRRRWARTFEVTAGRPVPRRAFRPPPKVDGQVLVVRRR